MENLVKKENLTLFYKGKRVLVTGHTGFKGAWLCTILHSLGAQVKGYSLAPEHENSLFNLLQPFVESESVIADIRNKEILKNELHAFEPEIIFHLAAQALVRRSYQIPAETFDINVTGTANLLESMAGLPGKCVTVIITTDKVYLNKENDKPFEEDDTLGGHDPYSASKACTELTVDAFRNSFFSPVNLEKGHRKRIVTARAGNVIGGGDWSADRIIPDIIRSFEAGKPAIIRNPNSIRPWQHVLEPLNGYLLLGMLLNDYSSEFSNAYNFGPLLGDHFTVRQLADFSIQKWAESKWIDGSSNAEPHEATLLKLNISRAKKELGWHPKLNAHQAIEWTIDWYRIQNNKKIQFTFDQINRYFSL